MSRQIEDKSGNYFPPCGINCNGCPNYTREKNKCVGYGAGCKKRKCKSIYVCCVEKRGLEFCYQCKSYPCSRFRKFANTWLKYGQDLLKNQEVIKLNGKERFNLKMNKLEKE